MRPVIVVTELRLLPPAERWPRLVAPLQQELSESGQGEVLDFEALLGETQALGHCPAEEVALEMAPGGFLQGYGRDTVDQVLASAGLAHTPEVMPARWAPYHCEEYFSGGWSVRGHFDELSQASVVLPLREAYEDLEIPLLVVGRPGVDGIDFGYRSGFTGLWAWVPMQRDYRLMAPTLDELVRGWCSGSLSV